MTASRLRNLLLVIGAVLVYAATAAAQTPVPSRGGRVYGVVGGGFGDGTFLLSGGGAGLRLTPRLGLDLEVAHLTGERDAHAGWSGGGVLAFYGAQHPISFPPLAQDRSVTTFLTRFTVEFPAAGGRLFPYLAGGGGVGRVREPEGSAFPRPPWPLFPALGPVAGGAATTGGNVTSGGEIAGLVGAWPADRAESGLALVVGGGLDVRLWQGLSVGAEVRWLRVLLSRDAFDTAQVASRISYRF